MGHRASGGGGEVGGRRDCYHLSQFFSIMFTYNKWFSGDRYLIVCVRCPLLPYLCTICIERTVDCATVTVRIANSCGGSSRSWWSGCCCWACQQVYWHCKPQGVMCNQYSVLSHLCYTDVMGWNRKEWMQHISLRLLMLYSPPYFPYVSYHLVILLPQMLVVIITHWSSLPACDLG